MKKIFLFLFLLAFATSCGTLKLAYNSTEDGKRTIVTSNVKLFNAESYHFDIAMGARYSDKDTILAVLVTSDKDSDHGIFDKGNRFMVKLAGGKIISLDNLYDKEFEEKTETVHTTDRIYSYGYEYAYSPFVDAVVLAPYEISSLVPRTYVRSTKASYALYLITKEQILDICQNKVIKLRVEIEDKDIDMPLPENAPGIFSELYTFLNSTIQNGFTRSEF